ncbi:hypothetical protein PGIGA_G00019210 [Pangasianodon gigas]|uniref:Uncharacterized protein n=1 Tax=Pangasianodon gigas TaxID=30993 RepID=A0ACC5WVC4_PANGG|nr:hypothetical protein [Pangasianodon gigas]
MEPDLQLLPTEPHHEPSAVVLPLGADEHLFPYYTNTEDCFTGRRCVSGRVREFISCNRMETSVNMPLEDYVQTIKKVTCTSLRVGADGQVDTSTWMQEHSHYSPHSDSESQPDSDLMCIFICWYSPEWEAIKFTVGVLMIHC